MKEKPHILIPYLCFALLFVLTLLQGFTHIIPIKPLNGFDKEEGAPVLLRFQSYWDGSYQKYLTEHAKRNTGFREFFIRSYNQVAYSCFGKITNNNIEKGLNHELYLKMYLNDVTGSTLRANYSNVENAKAKARENVAETQRLIDTLQRHNTAFLFVFAPSKTLVYPEYMPSQYQDEIADFSLQEYYIELFKENDIPHIDFLNYFRSVKDTVSYPLYTRFGTHWAASTIPWVADSILRRIEDLTQTNLPSVQQVDNHLTTDYNNQDRELEEQMNLLFPLSKPALPNSTFLYTDTLGKDRPNLLVIGDSYSVQLVHSNWGNVFNQWDFWMYNRDIYSSRPRFNWMVLNRELDAIDVLIEADVVVAVFTAPMYYNYMFGFPKTAQNLYQTGFVDDHEALLSVIDMIRRDSTWYNGVVKQAEQRNITVDESVLANAKYYLEFKRQNNLKKIH